MRTRAAKNYTFRLMATMAAYVVSLMAVMFYIREYDPQGALRVILSILPALPVLGAIAVIGIYLVEETDEYVRARIAMAMLVGTGFVLSFATVAGMLQNTDVIGKIDVFWAFPMWCFGWGLTECFLRFRDSRQGESA